MITTNRVLASFLVSGIVALTGCDADEGEDVTNEARNAEIVDNLIEAGFDEDDIEIRESPVLGESLRIDETEAAVFVDGDVQITLEASRELLGEPDEDDVDFRHWRTPARVTNNRTICLVQVTDSTTEEYESAVLPNRMRNAVTRAKNNYNALSSFNLTFRIRTGRVNAAGRIVGFDNTGCHFRTFIYRQPGAAGASAGFPAGGAPFGQIVLRTGLLNFDDEVLEHVVTHEIGHTIGLRHSDWRTRASCGGAPVNEGRDGAVRIPNTAYQTTNSVMAACFSAHETGDFRGEDAEALRRIY